MMNIITTTPALHRLPDTQRITFSSHTKSLRQFKLMRWVAYNIVTHVATVLWT